MAKTIATILGILFLVVGLLGFAAPGLMGMHLSAAHNVVHLVSGALALYFGTKGTYEAARTFCIIFGLIYGLLGLIGFVAGAGADYMLTLVPNQLMLGKMDHIIHVILGVVFILGGFSARVVATAAPADRTY